MPLKLIPPTPGRNQVYRVRGTYRKIYVDRTTETAIKAKAEKELKVIEGKIERGEFSSEPELTFADAALSYINAGGQKNFVKPITDYFGPRKIASKITQAVVDAAAIALYPAAMPATRNRQVYTPISAILRHAGVKLDLRRPKGAQGIARRIWLRPEQFEALAAAAMAEDIEFAALIILLCYTGLRLSEALRIACPDIDVDAAEAFCGQTKNGDPRLVYLPERVIAALTNHPRGLDRKERLFRWSKSAEIYLLAERVYAKAGIDHGDAPFHILRHTFGAWMTRVGADLVATGAWRSDTAARGYQHFDLTEESRKAGQLPGAKIRA